MAFVTASLLAQGIFVWSLALALLVSVVALAVTWRRAARAERRSGSEVLRSLLAQMPRPIFWKDRDGVYRGCNRAFLERHKLDSMSEVIGRRDDEMPWKEEAEGYRQSDRIVMSTRERMIGVEHTQWTASGSAMIVRTSKAPLLDARGRVIGVLGIDEDITKDKEAERKLEKLAFYDSLTGLPNRVLLQERLEQALKRVQRDQNDPFKRENDRRQLAVLYLDLDDFKHVNDTLGHDAGDKMLVEVTKRLRSCLRQNDTVARVGGDEFLVLLPDVRGPADIRVVVHKLLEAMRAPLSLEGSEIIVTMSIGITLAPKDGSDRSELLKNADIAMYRAKDLGRNSFEFFSPEMNRLARERLSLENELRRALTAGHFALHYQPQVRISTGQTEAIEALMRWQHPERGLVMPGDFIEAAEESGLIVPLGHWALRRACEQLVASRAAWRVSVNLSQRQFRDAALVETIRETLAATGLEPRRLELELTESSLMDDVGDTVRVLSELKALGIRIAIDDFGTGYSSLSRLKQLPVDTLKVDREFVRDLPHDEGDRAITVAVIAMAQELKLEVVAEGVETEAQLHYLRGCGCDVAQGYLLGRPGPIEDLIRDAE